MSEQLQIDFDACREAMDTGIQRAIEHADRVTPKWSSRALFCLIDFLAESDPGRTFVSEDVIAHGNRNGLPSPPHLRSWGSILLQASRRGLIEKVGIVPSPTPSNHMANKGLWLVK